MSSGVQAITQLLEARRAALVKSDAGALEQLLHADFRYVDSLGRELDRDAYLASRRGGEISFSRHDVTEINVRELTTDTALITCRVHDVGVFRGSPFEARYRAVHVCVRDSSGWLFLFGQSTSIGNV